MTRVTSRRKMLALCGTAVGLAGCSGGVSETKEPPTTTRVPTTNHEATATPTPTQSPIPNPSLLRTAVIDADNIDKGFEAQELEQIVIGQSFTILYEVEAPVQDGMYNAVVYVGLSEHQGNLNSMEYFPHEGSADGETTRFDGHTPPQPTEEFVPGKLGVDIHVGKEMNHSSDEEHFVVKVVLPTNNGGGDN